MREEEGRKHKGDTWWCNEEKEAVIRKKHAQKAMCQDNTKGNKRRYKSMRSKAKKEVSKATR